VEPQFSSQQLQHFSDVMASSGACGASCGGVCDDVFCFTI
jgi:hypothetical protein